MLIAAIEHHRSPLSRRRLAALLGEENVRPPRRRTARRGRAPTRVSRSDEARHPANEVEAIRERGVNIVAIGGTRRHPRLEHRINLHQLSSVSVAVADHAQPPLEDVLLKLLRASGLRVASRATQVEHREVVHHEAVHVHLASERARRPERRSSANRSAGSIIATSPDRPRTTRGGMLGDNLAQGLEREGPVLSRLARHRRTRLNDRGVDQLPGRLAHITAEAHDHRADELDALEHTSLASDHHVRSHLRARRQQSVSHVIDHKTNDRLGGLDRQGRNEGLDQLVGIVADRRRRARSGCRVPARRLPHHLEQLGRLIIIVRLGLHAHI